MTTWIGITLGDVTGIGPEVTIKALQALPRRPDLRWLVMGDRGVWERAGKFAELPWVPFRDYAQETPIACLETGTALPADLAPGSPGAARAAVDWLREAAHRSLRQELAGLVTAPVNKEAIIRAGIPFVGQTELLSDLAGTQRTAMMLLGHDDRQRWIRVVLVTTHLPLRQVADSITGEKVELAIDLAGRAGQLLGLPRARVGVCGLNPHAGEGGELGREELDTIGPAVERARERGGDVHGPLAADGLFYHAFQGEYDLVVAMYHDQGLAPLKMIGFESGINWTLGLPFIRTSPDHGTAYDLAWRGVAKSTSMEAALRLAARLAGKPLD